MSELTDKEISKARSAGFGWLAEHMTEIAKANWQWIERQTDNEGLVSQPRISSAKYFYEQDLLFELARHIAKAEKVDDRARWQALSFSTIKYKDDEHALKELTKKLGYYPENEKSKFIRKTDYCNTLAEAAYSYGDEEIRLERIFTKRRGKEEIRLSWWKDGRFQPRPADIDAEDWGKLFWRACKSGVFTPEEKLSMIRTLLSGGKEINAEDLK